MFRRTTPLAVLVLLAGLAAPAGAGIDANQRALDTVRERIAGIQDKLEKTGQARDSASRELQAVEQRIAEARRAERELQRRVRAQAAQISDTEQQLAAAQQRFARQRAGLRAQLRAAYITGEAGTTQLLLNLDDAQDVGRMLSYADYLQRAQFAAIDGIRAQQAALEERQRQLQAEQAELKRLQAEQAATLAQLRDDQAQRSRALAAIDTEMADENRQLKQLKADERSIRELIASLRKRLPDLPPAVAPSGAALTAQKGRLPWPLRGPLLARYGEPKVGGKLRWNGHWIAGDAGAPIKAVASGRAVYVGWMHRYGLIALIEHDAGYYSLYGHCQSVSLDVGSPVAAGQTIASAGDTGGYEQSGVYFEIRKGTDAVDPAAWLAH